MNLVCDTRCSRGRASLWDELQFDAGYPNVTGFLSVADL
jgi:hypothetical protein